MAVSLEKFTQQVIASGLMSAAEIDAFVASAGAQQRTQGLGDSLATVNFLPVGGAGVARLVENPPLDGEQLARLLVDAKKLTTYQTTRIFSGQGESLVLGNYIILDKLGQGGMGMVLKAMNRMMERTVALKVLSPAVGKSPETIQRFLREVKAVSRLEHPNIVTAHHADEANGTQFLVMQYIEGNDLAALVKKQGPLPIEQALSCVWQAARGLEYAHQMGVVHRDIKPGNLLLDRGGTLKILDMGLARLDSAGAAQDQLTGTGEIMGTIDFMAPEQALNTKNADARADIYSLGVTLWYLLTGCAVYGGESALEKLLAHREQPIPSLRQVCPQASPALEAVFAKMIAKKPESRYQSMTEVITALERAAAVPIALVGRSNAPSYVDVNDNQIAPTISLHNSQQSTDTLAGREIQSNSKPVLGKRPPWRRQPILLVSSGLGAALLVVLTIWMLVGGKGDRQASNITKTGSSEKTINSKNSDGKKVGWPGWPADAPPPAIAPFDAAQAKKHQQAWANYLKLPVEYTNTLGMKFVLIPPGEFTMGGTAAEIAETLRGTDDDNHWRDCIRSESPRHKVILTQPFYLGVHEVTQKAYEFVVKSNPAAFAPSGEMKAAIAGMDTSNYPVENVAWDDAVSFCAKLNGKEKFSAPQSTLGDPNVLPTGGYRLPTEAEWEFACRAGTTSSYWMGDSHEDLAKADWFGDNSDGMSHVVGKLQANPFGIVDVHGNVWEWVQDAWGPTYYAESLDQPAVNPIGPSPADTQRLLRGGSWRQHAVHCRAASRRAYAPDQRRDQIGFRASLSAATVKAAIAERKTVASDAKTSWQGWPADAPPPAIAPFDAAQAKKHQQAWANYLKIDVEYENTFGMKFVLIPPGEFMMGGSAAEIEMTLKEAGEDKHRRECIKSEGPQHKVILSQPIYLGVNEVTQAEYERVLGKNPSHFSSRGSGKGSVTGIETTNYPVEMVSWNDAAEFCAKLSEKEKRKPYYFRTGETVTLRDGAGYRLPTEAEWEFACRAGTTTKYWIGDSDDDLPQAGWFSPISGGRTHPVGKLQANPVGLCDIQGNVGEWVQDWWGPTYYSQFLEKPALNPNGPFSGSQRVLRGGLWPAGASYCRASNRYAIDPTDSYSHTGFRVCLAAVGPSK